GGVAGVVLHALRRHELVVREAAFAPDGQRLFSAGDDRIIRVWNPATGAEAGTLEGHAGAVNALAPSPDGRTLASAGADGVVILWDVATGKEARRLAQDREIESLAGSADGTRLATGSGTVAAIGAGA